MKNSRKAFHLALIAVGTLVVLGGQVLFVLPTLAHQSQANVNGPTSLQAMQQYGEAHCVQPPQNVDVMKLTDAQLSLYGLPLHAILDAQPAQWASHLQHAKQRTCGTSPITGPATHAPDSAITPNVIGRTFLNWAGNVAYGSRGTYRVASVDFTVPSIPNISSSQRVSIWAGVGGDPDYTSALMLVQAGVEIHRATFGGQYNTSFWEIEPYNNGEQSLPLSRLQAGDHIFALASSSADNDGYNYFYIDNETVNSYNEHYDYSNHLTDGASGECIVERPKVGSSYTDLANFGTEYLNRCDISTVTQSKYMISWPHDYYTMVNAAGTPLATVGSIVNNNYPVTFKRSK
jgi:hypothetical protein